MSVQQITRRDVLRRGTALAIGIAAVPLLEACGAAALPAPTATATAAPTPTPLPQPEATTIRIQAAACDAPIMAAERYLRDEGFTEIQIVDSGGAAALAGGKLDLAVMFPPSIANAVQGGTNVVALAGIHPGCVEIWAQQSVASLADLRGKTLVVRSKALSELAYSYTAVVLKQSGIDPKDVNFVVQADADTVKLYLDGKNDAVFVGTTSAAALKANPANKGHLIHSQAMDEPWSKLDCCILVTTAEWYRSNPIAAKRALRAILRAADAMPADRADAAKLATDKGLFGGPNSYAIVREAVNMVPLAWRDSDPEKSVRFFAPLLADIGLLKITADDFLKAVDLRILRELKSEMKT